MATTANPNKPHFILLYMGFMQATSNYTMTTRQGMDSLAGDLMILMDDKAESLIKGPTMSQRNDQ